MKKIPILLLLPLMMFAQESTLTGDVDCSGEVNSQDASLILQFVTNVIDELPCQQNLVEEIIINSYNGFFDLQFPDGYMGEPVLFHPDNGEYNYIVPDAKTLYITNIFIESAEVDLSVDGILIASGVWTDSNFSDFPDSYPGLTLSNPIIVGGGSTVSLTSGYINGFLVDGYVDPVIHNLAETEYIVPENKVLLVTQAKTENSMIYASVDGLINFPLFGQYFNSSFSGISQQNAFGNMGPTLNMPIILEAGTQINYGPGTFNGYLVDEDYFASSASSSIGSGNDNEINDQFEPITWNLLNGVYTVPSNKNLVITTSKQIGPNTNSLVIDDITVHAYTPNSIMENPIYAGSNQVVSGYGSFNGYLEDNDYLPISWDLNQNNYTVPEDKKLIIGVSQQINGTTNNILIDDIAVFGYSPNSIMDNLIYVGSSQIVSGNGSFNGYLVNE